MEAERGYNVVTELPVKYANQWSFSESVSYYVTSVHVCLVGHCHDTCCNGVWNVLISHCSKNSKLIGYLVTATDVYNRFSLLFQDNTRSPIQSGRLLILDFLETVSDINIPVLTKQLPSALQIGNCSSYIKLWLISNQPKTIFFVLPRMFVLDGSTSFKRHLITIRTQAQVLYPHHLGNMAKHLFVVLKLQ